MKVYDEHGKPYLPPRDEPERRDRDERNPGPQPPDAGPVDLGELLAGDDA